MSVATTRSYAQEPSHAGRTTAAEAPVPPDDDFVDPEAAASHRDGEPPSDPADDGGSPVPEPTTLLLVGTGLLGLAFSSRRWRRVRTS